MNKNYNPAWSVADEIRFLRNLGFHSDTRSVTTLARRKLFDNYLYGLNRRSIGFDAAQKAEIFKAAVEIGGTPSVKYPMLS